MPCRQRRRERRDSRPNQSLHRIGETTVVVLHVLCPLRSIPIPIVEPPCRVLEEPRLASGDTTVSQPGRSVCDVTRGHRLGPRRSWSELTCPLRQLTLLCDVRHRRRTKQCHRLNVWSGGSTDRRRLESAQGSANRRRIPITVVAGNQQEHEEAGNRSGQEHACEDKRQPVDQR